jgi:hypothetical protein
VKLSIQVRAAIRDDKHPETGIAGVEQRRQHHPARGNAEQHNGTDVSGPEDHLKVGSGERAAAVFRDDDITGPGSRRRTDCTSRTLKQLPVLRG